ncbi:D-alanyl-D-alanine carboxypeptidase/D-alanyl-D-alanine-endopeptidase [Henriciella sp.]|uniref:D-alanyl-D-alanine carboxypeptidase/D-alanyl-D-alanine endopeptidase n=1 Tax=Henriciella sp. TaxID=1968823 RepID=UPI002630DC8C|nr:D-alanyl-D-alanine carboxypeptidase/D-alanyl-D-alanine-endopeptidase [Henriciella sp.]
MTLWPACLPRPHTAACTITTLVLATLPASAQSLITEGDLADPEGGRWGISVMALDGTSFVDVNADARLAPASTLKLVTTAAAFEHIGNLDAERWPKGTALYLQQEAGAPYPSLVIQGTGDANLSNAADCEESCLSDLADAVVARGITDIQNIDVDDSLFQRPHWPDGWPHDDLRFAYGTSISALSVNDAVAKAEVRPGSSLGTPPQLSWRDAQAFNVDTSNATTTQYGFDLEFFMQPGSNWGELTGTIGLSTGPVQLSFGLSDPSLHTGRLLHDQLTRKGVTLHGLVRRQDEVTPVAAPPEAPELLFQQDRPDPRTTLTEILHESNNFHAEVLLHHLSMTRDDQTTEAGIELMEDILTEAGADRRDFDISDASGLSVYNRVTPDTMTGLLVWAAGQDWYEAWSGLLAGNGQDGTLEYRLTRGVQSGVVRAKSGTLFGADGLAGYFTARSGRQYAFAIYLSNSALSHGVARRRIDEVLEEMINTF